MARSRSKQEPHIEEATEDWAVSYADMITLLMSFFVLLFSMSTLDPAKFEQTSASINEQGGAKPEMPIAEVMKQLQDAVAKNSMQKSVEISSDGAGIVVEFASSALFDSAKAIINEPAIPLLSDMIKLMAAPQFARYGIEVEGHTDDVPINTTVFPSNWELSGSRAASVIKLFREYGFDIGRLKATGFAYTQPKLPNRSPEGVPMPENQAANRRIVIRLYPMTARTMPENLRKEMQRLNEAKNQEAPSSPGPTPGPTAIPTHDGLPTFMSPSKGQH